jgi:hypothetical protein
MARAAAPDQKAGVPGTHRTDAMTDIALTLPIFIAYHLGVVFLPVRNAADIVTSRLAGLAEHDKALYLALTAAIGVATTLGILALGHREKLKASTFLLVAVEGVAYAAAMRYLASLVVGALPMARAPGVDGPFTAIVMSLGAGFYEEMAFRVILFGLGARFLMAIDDWPKWAVQLGWGIICATGFSAWHHIGPMGEPFTLHAFVFRTICGLTFTAIYAFRGFAPAVWTHALYDIWAMAL